MAASDQIKPMPVPEQIDHLVLATPDVAEGIRYVEELFGVSPAPGGHHPVYGTRNALVALGESSYLEIIGPDEKMANHMVVRVFGIHQLERPRLATWAARGSDLQAVVVNARKEMVDLGGITVGTRKRSDGRELSWMFTDPLAARNGGVLPFFIDWGDSEHPASNLPCNCELLELILHHPHAADVRQRLHAVGLDMPVTPAAQPRVAAKMRTPRGVVEL